MFMNGNRATSQGTAKAGFLDLPHSFANAHRVVFGHDSFRLHAEDPVQVRPAGTTEGTPLLFGCNGELTVESVNVVLAQESVGLFPSADAGQPQFLGQASLPSAEIRSDRPRAWGEYAGIICTPNSFNALPTCVKRCLSTGPPAFGVRKK